jgi:hypothetical protein
MKDMASCEHVMRCNVNPKGRGPTRGLSMAESDDDAREGAHVLAGSAKGNGGRRARETRNRSRQTRRTVSRATHSLHRRALGRA